MKKRTLKKICDYWEHEARRCGAEADHWQRRCLDAERALGALRADPLAAFRAEFQAEALRQIDAWPASPDEVEPDQHQQTRTEGPRTRSEHGTG